jgi:SNF2 family DNA or RNA helicase
MSAVIPDLDREVAALRSIRQRALPGRVRETKPDSIFGEVIELLVECTRLAKQYTAQQEQPTRTEEATMPTPYDLVRQHYSFPFEQYKFQVGVTNELGPKPRAGLYMDPGTGKTSVSTHIALFKHLTEQYQTTLVLMPPILVPTWRRWLQKVTHADGRPLSVTCYHGGPKKREKIKLQGEFILMPLTIFKRDYAKIVAELGHRRVVVILDEAHSVKNVASANHEKLAEFCEDKPLMLLTGTPLTTPKDAYAYCKLVAPGTYRNLHHFENLHGMARDFYGEVIEWRDLDVIARNMKINAVRILKEEVLTELPEVTFTPLYYDLDDDHYKLYRRIAEEQLVRLDDGGKLDLTSASALYHALQQVVLNWDYFGQDASLVAKGYELLDEVMEEIGDRKCIVFASYRMTNRTLLRRLQKQYNAVAVFGDITRSAQNRNVDKFLDDPTCRVLIGQPTSVGYGVDGLQEVCSDVFYLESPTVPRDFTQSLARVYRDGQKKNVHCRIAVAERTLQVRLFNNLMKKDQMVNLIQGGWKDLRDAIFGG